MKLIKFFMLTFFTVVLIACGGAEERKAVYMEKAKTSIASGDLDKARIELKNVLQIDPKDAEAYYQLGKVYEKQKNYQKAYSHFLKVEKLDPEHLANHAQLGKIYLLLVNDVEKTQQKIDLILTKDPGNPDGLLLKSTLMLKNNDIEKAIIVAQQVIDTNPKFIDGITFLATLYFKNKQPKVAIRLLDKSLKTYPGNESLNRLLALFLVNEKDYKRAEVLYNKFLKDNPDSRNSYNTLAAFYAQSGDKEKSEKVLKDSISNDPEDVERYLTLVKYVKSTRGDKAAIKELESFVKNNSGVGKLRIALGELYLISGDKQSAINTFKKCIDDFPEELTGVDAQIVLATIYLSDKNINGADKIINDAIQVSPNDPKINLLRAKVALLNKDSEVAIISLRTVIKEMPENINAYFLLAGAYNLEKNTEQVKSILTTAYNNNKNNPKALLKLAEYYLTNDIELADKIIQDYNKLKDSDYDGMAITAAILNKKKLYSDANVIAEKLMTKYPEKSAGYFNVTPYLVEQGEIKKAISLLDEGYEKTGKSKVLLSLLTQLLVSEKQFDKAENLIKDKLNTSPTDSSLKVVLARLYITKNDLPSAITLLENVIKASPTFEGIYVMLAQIYQKQNDIDAAKLTLEKGRTNITSSVNLSLRLASLYEVQGEYSQAIKIYRESYKQYPDNLIVINNLASTISDHGESSDLELAKKLAIKLDENKQDVFQDTIGWVYYRLGDNETAIKYLSKATESSPKIAIFNYHLGMAYKQAGDKLQAKIYLEKSLASGKNFKEKEKAKTALKEL